MKVRRNFALSRRALVRHRVRTALAVSGTAVGVAAVLIMIALGEGAEREVLRQIEAMGRNVLVVAAGPADRPVGRSTRRGPVTTLKLSDAEAIAEECPAVALAAPAQDRPARVKYGTLTRATTILGTTPDFGRIRNFRTSDGRYFTLEENRASLRVALLGSQVAEVLFGDADPIGASIRIDRVPFEVIGVLESKGMGVEGGSNEDDLIVIPIRTALRRVFNLDYLKMVWVQVRAGQDMDRAQAQITDLLRRRHRLDRRARPDDFRIRNQQLVLAADMEAAASFRRLITALASVALIVGGVGILSIMLLSIRERRAEIGLRIAVGAKRRDVRAQFLVEAVLLGVGGGVVGLVLGVLAAASIEWGTDWQTVVSPAAVALALGAAFTVSFVFGVYPAQRAASLDPIEALRAE